ncbi:MAG: hypothetical protein ACMUEL_04540 [Flavobacteriales bacterium Tduv]
MIVDASITVSPFASKGAPTYVVKDRKEEGKKQIFSKKNKGKKETQSGVDTQGKWLKKSGKLYYGYKKHIGWIKWNDTSVHSIAPMSMIVEG